MGHIQKVIGRNVKDMRNHLGLTQQVLAEKSDISIPFLASSATTATSILPWLAASVA